MMRSLATALALFAVTGSAQAQTIDLKVMGQPLATGLIQKTKEQPFFENLAERTGLPVEVSYTPVDVSGMKDTDQLRFLKAGLFDIVSLRLSQVSRDEPTVLGFDLVGLNPTYEAARKVIDAYSDTVDQRLQAQFNTKLLGVWPFGPQVLFCKPEISGLADLSGKKVRVYDQSLAQFVSKIGGTPVPLSFAETQQALARGVVDCAITGPSSANSAGWPEVTSYMMPLGFQIAVQGYGINLDSWSKFTPEQQATLEQAIDGLVEEIWAYSQEIFDDAVRCNVGQEPCTTVKQYNLTEVPVTEADLELIGTAVPEVSLPAWSDVCDRSNPSCTSDWKAIVGPVAGLD
jgi:TRAP-type transport system periplasmic protein